MTTDDTHREDTGREERVDWTRLGRAAEDFARHVAHDASRFAERVEEHARDLARDVGREWRHAERRHRRDARDARSDGAEEMRRVFADVRTLVADVLDGVDDLISRFFPERGEAAHEPPSPPPPPSTPAPPTAGATRPWTAVVANRSGVCSACGSGIPVGAESFVRVADGEPEFRCSACGTDAPH